MTRRRDVTARIRELARSLPRSMVAGIAVIVLGLSLDVGYHVVHSNPSLAAPCCGVGFAGHVVTLLGMVLALVGVVALGLRSGPSRRTEGGDDARTDLAIG